MLKGYDNIKHKRLGNIKIKEPIFPPHPPIGSFYFKWYFYLYYSLQLKNKNVITLVGRSPDFDFFHYTSCETKLTLKNNHNLVKF